MTDSTSFGTTEPAPGATQGALAASQRRRQWKRNVTVGLLVLAALSSGFMLARGLASVRGERKKDLNPQVFALLLISQQQPRFFSDSHFQAKATQENFAIYVQTQEALVTSRLVLSAALRNPPVAKLEIIRQQLDPIEWLENHLQVDHSLSPEIIRVGMTGRNATELAMLVNAVVDAYMAEVVYAERNLPMSRLENLQKILMRNEDDIRNRRENLKQLADVFRVMPPFEVKIKQQQLSDYVRELTRVSIAKIAATAKLQHASAKKAPAAKADPQSEYVKSKLQDEITLFSEQERLLDTEIRKLREDMGRATGASTEIELRKDELEKTREISNKLRSEMEALKVEVQSMAERVRVLQRAEAPGK